MLTLLFAILADDDKGLIDRLRARDPEALAALYDRYGALVFSLILRIVADRGVAEDLVQEVFLRVWNRIGEFDGARGAIGPWLTAVARNRAIDHLRGAKARVKTDELTETDHPVFFVDMDAELLSAEARRRIAAALDRLGAQERRVLELAYFEGLSQSEIAEKLGQPLGTIKTWTRRALQLMRAELNEWRSQ